MVTRKEIEEICMNRIEQIEPINPKDTNEKRRIFQTLYNDSIAYYSETGELED